MVKYSVVTHQGMLTMTTCMCRSDRSSLHRLQIHTNDAITHNLMLSSLCTKRALASTPTVEEFINKCKEVKDRSGHSMVTDQMEDCLFCEFFGCHVSITFQLWNLLDEHGFVPISGQIYQLLWTIFFMKQCLTEGVACGAVGGSKGRADPKTYRKWMHPFIEALSNLEPYVVSLILFYFY